MSRPLVCVVDANVALRLVFEQDHSDRADRLFRHLAEVSGARFYVPDLFFAEFASALTLFVRHHRYPAAKARKDLADMVAMAPIVVPTFDLVKDAMELSLAHWISGYDAVYVALSKRLGAPLVTVDGGLVNALNGKPFQILPLAELEI